MYHIPGHLPTDLFLSGLQIRFQDVNWFKHVTLRAAVVSDDKILDSFQKGWISTKKGFSVVVRLYSRSSINKGQDGTKRWNIINTELVFKDFCTYDVTGSTYYGSSNLTIQESDYILLSSHSACQVAPSPHSTTWKERHPWFSLFLQWDESQIKALCRVETCPHKPVGRTPTTSLTLHTKQLVKLQTK